MASKDATLDPRRSTILRKVVTEHIATGQPVGSAHLVRDDEIDVSAATVRSDMASLERDGFLTHPHTSAGRIPTDKGYRYFVDHIEGRTTLDPASAQQVDTFFRHAHGELERMFRDTSQLLSKLTDYAAVVVGPTHEALTIRSALITRLAPTTALVVVICSNGVVEKGTIEFDETITDDEVDAASVILRDQLSGRVVSRVAALIHNEQGAIGRILDAATTVVSSVPIARAEEVYVGGASHMANQFTETETVRQVLDLLEQSFVVVTLISDLLASGRSVAIGTESGLASLSECSIVVAPYWLDADQVGTIGVLGPTRMNYPQALATVAVVSNHLSRQLSSP